MANIIDHSETWQSDLIADMIAYLDYAAGTVLTIYAGTITDSRCPLISVSLISNL